MRREDSAWWREGFTKEWWEALDDVGRFNFLELLDDEQLIDFHHDWRIWGRDKQILPQGVWSTCLLNCGRGFGKTRTGVEYIKDDAKAANNERIAIVGQGEDDIREVMIEGDSGFLATAHPDFRPIWRPSVGTGRLEWPNGVTGYVYSAEDPESLRGPQFGLGWFDEPMAVPAEKRIATVMNLRMGLRKRPRNGCPPRLIYTTTPKPHRWIREERAKAKKWEHLPVEQRKYIWVEGSTFENRDNLAEAFFDGIVEDYDGTNLGRQELYAEILGEEEGAIWTTETLDKQRLTEIPGFGPIPEDPIAAFEMRRAFARTCELVVVGVDPNTTTTSKTAHAAGIVVVAKRGLKRYVLEDRSTKGGPAEWSRKAVEAYVDYEANEIVPEVNQGGEMVSITCQQAADDMEVDIKVHMVRATRGKQRRAEPVGSAYVRGMVHHLGAVGTSLKPGPFYKLESQMTALHDAHDPTGEDFDRCDAAVWALTRTGLKSKAGRKGSSGGTTGIMTFSDFEAHG